MAWTFGPRPMPPGYRDTVRRVAEELQRAERTVEDELSERYAASIADWSAEHGCMFGGDYTDAQWARQRLWEGTGWCVADAERAWANKTRSQFARFLAITQRIGEEVTRRDVRCG